jgi:hypothetical protein
MEMQNTYYICRAHIQLCFSKDEIKHQLNDEERVITDLLEAMLHELDNGQDNEVCGLF